MTRLINFSAGPSALPLAALQRAQRELLEWENTGMSVMEQSHRGEAYEALHSETIELLRTLLGADDRYDVLLLHGGASMQFVQVPLNLLHRGALGEYVLTGIWGEKALAEGRTVAALIGGNVSVAASTGDGSEPGAMFTRVPTRDEIKVTKSAAYLHVTTNETIHGVQYPMTGGRLAIDNGDVPIVADMSSDFLSKKIDVSSLGMIYAGAQKNVGPSGLCVAVIRKDLIATARRDLPKLLSYEVAAKNGSMYNTPSTFGVYMMRNVLAWINDVGGLAQIEAWNHEKSRLIYEAVDAAPAMYHCPVEQGSRSEMNIVFRLPSASLEKAFLEETKRRGMVGLRGHRTAGGIRVSLYNAVTVESAQALAHVMRDFEQKNKVG